MPCIHPLASLKFETAEQDKGQVTIRFCCTACLAPITKQFMLHVPEPTKPAPIIGELLDAEDGAPAPAKVHGANSPWRNYNSISQH